LKLTLVDTMNGFYDFDVKDAGPIYRVTVGMSIKQGDMFNIYYRKAHNASGRKGCGYWFGKNGFDGKDLTELENSIRKSELLPA